MAIEGCARRGVLHARGGGAGGVTRLAAFVVAPGMRREELLAQLRQRIDAAFLPRPLVVLERLPRAASGKLPLEALRELARAHQGGGKD